jgi:hypothetical protein
MIAASTAGGMNFMPSSTAGGSVMRLTSASTGQRTRKGHGGHAGDEHDLL